MSRYACIKDVDGVYRSPEGAITMAGCVGSAISAIVGCRRACKNFVYLSRHEVYQVIKMLECMRDEDVFNFRMLKEGFSSNDLPYYQRHIDSIPLDLAWLYCWLALAGQRELLFA
jgi:hypothetical protein